MENKETMEERPDIPAAEAQDKPGPETGPEDGAEALREFIRHDAEEFRRQYPQVELRELDADAAFRLFCGSRYGREPLADLYGDYLVLRAQAGESDRRRESRSERATGSGGSGGGEALTAAEQRELSEWNKAYPHMKMTAKEYLAR